MQSKDKQIVQKPTFSTTNTKTLTGNIPIKMGEKSLSTTRLNG